MKMIIFKLILTSFKQNLRLGGSNFILGTKKKYKELYIYIYIYNARLWVHLNPLALR